MLKMITMEIIAGTDEKQRAYRKNHAEKRWPDYWRFQESETYHPHTN